MLNKEHPSWGFYSMAFIGQDNFIGEPIDREVQKLIRIIQNKEPKSESDSLIIDIDSHINKRCIDLF